MKAPDLSSIDDKQKVWVSNLPLATTSEDLHSHFQQLGPPVAAHAFKNGKGVVAFQSDEQAEMAISMFNSSEISGQRIQTASSMAGLSTIQAGGKYSGSAKAGSGKGSAWCEKGHSCNCKGGEWREKGWGDDDKRGAGGAWERRLVSDGGAWENTCGSDGAAWEKGLGRGKGCTLPKGGKGKADMMSMMWDMMTKVWGDESWSKGCSKDDKGGGGCDPQKQLQVPQPPTADPTVHWLKVPMASALAAQGFPLDGPAVVYDRIQGIFNSAAYILSDIVGDISTEVQIVHDMESTHFPDIGEVLKKKIGEESCFAVAVCPSRACWGIGVAAGWKHRESSSRLAVSLALCVQEPSHIAPLCEIHPEFKSLCIDQGLIKDSCGVVQVGAVQAPQAISAAPLVPALMAPFGNVLVPAPCLPVINGGCPPVHFLTILGPSSITMSGLPPQGLAVPWSKQLKLYFSQSHHILAELVEDVPTQCALTDDAEWTVLPEVGRALKLIGAEENCYCVASCSSAQCWGVGLAAGWKGRESAAKFALAIAIAQRAGRLREIGLKFPEFAEVCSHAGLLDMPMKRPRLGMA